MRDPFLCDFASAFTSEDRATGRALLRRRRVQLHDNDAYMVTAKVRAPDGDFHVYVGFVLGSPFLVTCECPRHCATGGCAHAWAALLAIDRRQVLSAGLPWFEGAAELDDGADGGVGEDVGDAAAEDAAPS